MVSHSKLENKKKENTEKLGELKFAQPPRSAAGVGKFSKRAHQKWWYLFKAFKP